MKAVWGYYESSSIQGKSNSNMVRAFNTLKRDLKRQQDDLLMDHQDETTISGGNASTFQFHYLLVPDITPMALGTVAAAAFDANTGAAGSLTPAATPFGTASTYFETRRDFYEPGRGF